MATAYQDYIASLTPNHYMALDGNSTDTGYGDTCTLASSSGVDLNATPITLGATYSAGFTSGKMDYGDADDTNLTGPWFRRSYSVWAQTSLKDGNYTIFNEGATVRCMQIQFGLGGIVQYIVDNDADSNPGCPWSQSVVSDNIKMDTPYHIGMVWESDRTDTGPSGKGKSIVKAYLNGRLIQEKEIYKWDSTNNEEILTEPGGQLNAHSGNIELGQGQGVIVSKKTFTTLSLTGNLSDMCWWDNVLLSDDQMWQLFKRGALVITADLTLNNVETGTEVRIFEVTGSFNEIGTGVESASSESIVISYSVASTIDVRLVILAPGKEVFSKIVTLPREGIQMDASVLLKNDRNYKND